MGHMKHWGRGGVGAYEALGRGEGVGHMKHWGGEGVGHMKHWGGGGAI